MTLTKDQIIAFAAFLQSEKVRHQEDIDMIDAKLAVLKSLGIEPEGTAPWIETKDLYDACKESIFDAQMTRVEEVLEQEEGSWVVAYVASGNYHD
jgi:hypothetical protein